MGIRDLYPLLKRRCPGEVHEVNVAELGGNKVAVDTSIYLYRSVRSCGKSGWLDQFVTFVCNLKRFRLHPIFIFDGPGPPSEKKKEQARRRQSLNRQKQRLKSAEDLHTQLRDQVPGFLNSERGQAAKTLFGKSVFPFPIDYSDSQSVTNALAFKIEIWRNQTVRVTPAFAEKAKDVLTLLGLPFIQADGEAETVCAFLAVHGQVDAVLSDDSDVLAYGVPLVFSQLKYKPGPGTTTVRVVVHDRVCTALGLSHCEFRDLCILLGCDYNSRARMHGKKTSLPVGMVRALELISEYRDLETIEKILVDPHNLLYVRCRELFSVPPAQHLPSLKFSYPLPLALDEWKKFLRKNGSRLSLAWIQHLWTPALFPGIPG